MLIALLLFLSMWISYFALDQITPESVHRWASKVSFQLHKFTSLGFLINTTISSSIRSQVIRYSRATNGRELLISGSDDHTHLQCGTIREKYWALDPSFSPNDWWAASVDWNDAIRLWDCLGTLHDYHMSEGN
jgi:hypothetical protein